MNKTELLNLLRLLSAIEGWSYAIKQPLPSELSESLGEAVKLLSQEVVK